MTHPKRPDDPTAPHRGDVRDEEVLIVGAGPIGIACAISARRRGYDPLLIDAGAIVNSIANYPPQMVFFTTPELLEIGGHPLTCAGEKPTRAEAMKYYRGVVRAEELRVATYTRLLSVDAGARTKSGALSCDLEGEHGPWQVRCQRLILATGYFDQPNKLRVPGEDLPHVRHLYDEGHRHYGRDVVVIGGKNSAVEASLDLFRSGARATIVYRGAEFPRGVKYWLRPDLENRIAAGSIAARMSTTVESIEPRHVVVRNAAGETERLPADRVFALLGYQPDEALFRRVGIEIEEPTGRPVHDPRTLETNISGVFIAGSITAGRRTSEVFIENGRFDGEKILAAW
ncbi:MAG: YpdA family putative bacillithiol disulfide reductase [Planctomycetota bacterium]